MKLAATLIAALVVAISAVMATNGYLRLRTETKLLESVTAHELRAMASAVATGVAVAWERGGEEKAQRFVRDVNRERDDIEVRWVWLDQEGSSLLSTPRLDRLRRGRPVAFTTPKANGGARRHTYWPLSVGSEGRAALEISTSLRTQEAFLASSRWRVLTTTIGLIAVCGLIMAAAGYGLVGRPLQKLRDRARRIGEGEMFPPLVLRQRDEIGELAAELNAMCERLHAAQIAATREAEQRIATLEQLRHSDRLRTVGQLASGIAHELGTPLNVVLGHAKMIRDEEVAEAEARNSADVIVEQVGRMTSIVRHLLDFARRSGPRFEQADLAALAERTVKMLQPMAESAGVSLEIEAPPSIRVDVDAAQIQQALTNLVVNGIQATPRGGRVRVSLRRADCGPRREAVLEVADDGAGVSEEELDRIFEPFYTTKDPGEGTGLGLSVAYGIVEEHGGSIELEIPPRAGSRFSIRLPIRTRGETQEVGDAT